MKWAYLSAAILVEVSAALALQAAVRTPGWYSVVVVGYLAAFFFLTRVLKRGVAVGVAYGIWGAAGVALTALTASVLFEQPLTGSMIVGLILVIVGVLLVEAGSQHGNRRSRQRSTPASGKTI